MCNTKLNLKIASLFLLCSLKLSQGAYLRFYDGSLYQYTTTTLDKPLEILRCIDPSLPTVIYTFGYRGKRTGPATTAVLSAYIANRKRNVILLDWEEEAKSGLLGIALGYAFSAVPNAKKIGRELGDALIILKKYGLDLENIHLIGHSLGAHIMGFAGRRVRQNGRVIPRITGLDPARALFEGVLSLQSGLDRTCARFVDIVHTDPGGYGISTAMGTVDIWPNYGRKDGTQPGCPVGDFDMFTQEDLCSHDRSWRYFVEALQAPTAFPCAFAENYEDWITNGGVIERTIYLGDLINVRAKGNFFLNTNSYSPYGMGAEGTMPYDYQRRKRRVRNLIKTPRYYR